MAGIGTLPRRAPPYKRSLPLTFLWLRRGLEAAIAFHFVIDATRFLFAYSRTSDPSERDDPAEIDLGRTAALIRAARIARERR